MIIIVGGGISGLAAAFELRQRGVPFKLLEATPRPGGLIRTEDVDGFTIDAGADSMLATKPAAWRLCDEIGLTPQVQHTREPRAAYVLAGTQLFPLPSPSVLGLPLTPWGALQFTLLPPAARVRLMFERFVPGRASGDRGDESIAAFFERRFGPVTVERVAQPLLGGIHAGDVTQLSIRSLFPNLVEAEARGSVLRSLGRRAPRSAGMFDGLRGGMETLPRALAAALPPGAVHYGAEVTAVSKTTDGWALESPAGPQRGAAVIFASPVHATARLLRHVDPHAASLCAGIPHASTVSVVLAWPRDAIAHPLLGTGFVVASGGSARITACTWVSSKWDARAPEGHALLRAFAGGTRDPKTIECSDDELVAIATRDLGRILGITAPPRLARVYRWPDASPQLNVGHDDRVAGVTAQLAAHPGLFVTGRGFRAVGIPDCIADARAVAAEAAQKA